MWCHSTGVVGNSTPHIFAPPCKISGIPVPMNIWHSHVHPTGHFAPSYACDSWHRILADAKIINKENIKLSRSQYWLISSTSRQSPCQAPCLWVYLTVSRGTLYLKEIPGVVRHLKTSTHLSSYRLATTLMIKILMCTCIVAMCMHFWLSGWYQLWNGWKGECDKSVLMRSSESTQEGRCWRS